MATAADQASQFIADANKAPSKSSRAIVIRVKNAKELAAGQSALAAFVGPLLPDTIDAEVYKGMADKLRQSLKDNKVDADISVIDASQVAGAPPAPLPHDGVAFGAGAAVGAGVVGLGFLLYRLIKGGR